MSPLSISLFDSIISGQTPPSGASRSLGSELVAMLGIVSALGGDVRLVLWEEEERESERGDRIWRASTLCYSCVHAPLRLRQRARGELRAHEMNFKSMRAQGCVLMRRVCDWYLRQTKLTSHILDEVGSNRYAQVVSPPVLPILSYHLTPFLLRYPPLLTSSSSYTPPSLL